jgi:hypothetical protein
MTMASIYRRTRSYPIPEGATIAKGQVRWTDQKGRKRKGLLNEAGDRVLVPSGNYVIAYFDHEGRRVELNSGTPDRDAAEQIAGRLETEAALRRRGIIDPTQERFVNEGRRTLAHCRFPRTLDRQGQNIQARWGNLPIRRTFCLGLLC